MVHRPQFPSYEWPGSLRDGLAALSISSLPTCSQQPQPPPQQPLARHRSSRVSSATMGRFPMANGPASLFDYRVPPPPLNSPRFSRPATSFHEVSPSVNGQLPANSPIVGMRDVAAWLKSLRLHKYTTLFQQLSYDEMMALDERTLEQLGVTKGARKKILQSTEQLSQRPKVLRQTEEMLYGRLGTRCLNCAIATLRQMLGTPIRPYSRRDDSTGARRNLPPCTSIADENLPAMVCCVLYQVHFLVFGGGGTGGEDVEDEYLFMILNVYDRILSNEAFTAQQKERVLEWKREARKFVSPADLRRHRVNTPHTGKCDSCLKVNQDAFHQDQKTIYRNLASVRDFSRMQNSFGLDPSLVLNQHQIMLLFLQQQLLQQQQQELLRPEYVAEYVHAQAQSLVQQHRLMGGRPLSSVDDQKSRNPLFGPQPASYPCGFAPPLSTQVSPHSDSSVYPSPQTSPVSPHSASSVCPSPQTSPVSEVYSSSDIRGLCSPILGCDATQPSFADFSKMSIGTWRGVSSEAEVVDFSKKGAFEVFSCHESTSGYSSGSSERGSAGSPGAVRPSRPPRPQQNVREAPPLLCSLPTVPSVDVNWIFNSC